MVSSYTANLAAFLTIDTVVTPINNAEDLANLNGKIEYGAKRGGSTLAFFRDSNSSEVYSKMWNFMYNNQRLLTSSNDEGVNMVKDMSRNYAFLMESTSIEYTVERNCDLAQVGRQLDEKGYGIAMRRSE